MSVVMNEVSIARSTLETLLQIRFSSIISEPVGSVWRKSAHLRIYMVEIGFEFLRISAAASLASGPSFSVHLLLFEAGLSFLLCADATPVATATQTYDLPESQPEKCEEGREGHQNAFTL